MSFEGGNMGEIDYLHDFYISPLHGDCFYKNQSNLVDDLSDYHIQVNSVSESDPDDHSRWELRISGFNINPNPNSLLQQLVSPLQDANVPFCVWNDVVWAITGLVQRRPHASTRGFVGVLIIINRYVDTDTEDEEEEEEEEEEYEDVIFIWEIIKVIWLMLMILYGWWRRRNRGGYVGELKMVRVEGGEKDKECVVCLEEFIVGLEVAKLPCEHIFHGDCVRRWLKKRGTCPLCRHWSSSSRM